MPLSPFYANNPAAILKTYGAASPEMREYLEAHPESDFEKGVQGFIDDIGTGLKNAFYDLTGQEDKTSFYQAQVAREDELIKRQEEREDTAMQRAAADMEASGLSKYGLSGGSAGSSAGGSSNVHSGSNVDFGAMLDILKAKSEIENVEANTKKTNAEAAATTAGIERDDKYYELSEMKANSEVQRNELLNILTKEQTSETAARTLSVLNSDARAEAKHVVDMMVADIDRQLKQKNLNWADMDHNAQLSLWDVQYRKSEAEIGQIAQKIAESNAYISHLSAEDKMLAIDYITGLLNYEVLAWNYDYSVTNYLRTNDQPSRPLGVNVNSLGGGFATAFVDGNPNIDAYPTYSRVMNRIFGI